MENRKNEMNWWQGSLRKGLALLLVTAMLVSVFAVNSFAWIRAELEVNVDTTDVTFIVPELVYLKPGAQAFQFISDQKTDGSPNANSRSQGTGLVYFAAQREGTDAADVKISARRLDSNGKAVNDVTLQFDGDGLPSGGDSPVNRTLLAEGSTLTSTELKEGETCLIEWTVEYTLADGSGGEVKYTTYAYTTVYAPCLQETGMVGNHRWVGTFGANEWNNVYAMLAGVHRVGRRDDSVVSVVKNPLSALTPAFVDGYLGNANDKSTPSFGTDAAGGVVNWSNNNHGSSGRAEYPGETIGNDRGVVAQFGAITVDTSRHTNLNQVPNLGAGFNMMNAGKEYNEFLSFAVTEEAFSAKLNSIRSAGGNIAVSTTVSNLSAGTSSGKGEANLLPKAFGLYPLQADLKSLAQGNTYSTVMETAFNLHHKIVSAWFITNDYDMDTTLKYTLNVNAVSKNALRLLAQSATAMAINDDATAYEAKNSQWEADYNTFKEALRTAYYALGDPTVSQGQIDAAKTALAVAKASIVSYFESESLRLSIDGRAAAPEAVYLAPGKNTIFNVVTWDTDPTTNSQKDPTKMPADKRLPTAGNPGDARLQFSLPNDVGDVASTMKIKYTTVDRNGNPDALLVNNVKLYGNVTDFNNNMNATAVAHDTPTGYPTVGSTDTNEVWLRFEGETRDSATGECKEGGIQWTFSFEYLGVTYESYAVTWVHPSPTVQAGVAGVFGTRVRPTFLGMDNGEVRTREYYYSFITGIHYYTGGNAQSKFNSNSATTRSNRAPLSVNANLVQNYGRDRTSNDTTKWALGDYVPQGSNSLTDNTYFSVTPNGGVYRDTTLREHNWGKMAAPTYRIYNYNKFNDQKNQNNFPHAIIAYDSSRFGGQGWETGSPNPSRAPIPFLSVGTMAFYTEGLDKDLNHYTKNVFAANEANGGWGDGFVFVYEDTGVLQSGRRVDVSAAGLKMPSNNAKNILPSVAQKTKNFIGFEEEAFARGNAQGSTTTARSEAFVYMDFYSVNKGSLRSNLQKAQQVFRGVDYYDQSEYDAYRTDIFKAGGELGRVMLPGVGNSLTVTDASDPYEIARAAWQTKIDDYAKLLAFNSDKDNAPQHASASYGHDHQRHCDYAPQNGFAIEYYKGVDGNPVAHKASNGVTVSPVGTGEPYTAWDHLYKPELINDAAGNALEYRNTGSLFKNRSYATYLKNANGEPFYAENILAQEINEANFNKRFPSATWPGGTVYYQPGPNNSTGRYFTPSDVYVETIPLDDGTPFDGATSAPATDVKVIHPLVTPNYTYGGTAYDTVPLPTNDAGQWTAFWAAYPQYREDGSYRVHNGKILPLATFAPDHVTDPQYTNGSRVLAAPEQVPGFYFYSSNTYKQAGVSVENVGFVKRWGLDTNQAYAAQNNMTFGVAGINAGRIASSYGKVDDGTLLNGLHGFPVVGSGSLAAGTEDRKVASPIQIAIAPKGTAPGSGAGLGTESTPGQQRNKFAEAVQPAETALKYPLAVGRVRYDFFYFREKRYYRYTMEPQPGKQTVSELYDENGSPAQWGVYDEAKGEYENSGQISIGDFTPGDSNMPEGTPPWQTDQKDQYFATKQYYAVTVDMPYPNEKTPVGYKFMGWRFSGDGNIYNGIAENAAGAERAGVDRYQDKLLWDFDDPGKGTYYFTPVLVPKETSIIIDGGVTLTYEDNEDPENKHVDGDDGTIDVHLGHFAIEVPRSSSEEDKDDLSGGLKYETKPAGLTTKPEYNAWDATVANAHHIETITTKYAGLPPSILKLTAKNPTGYFFVGWDIESEYGAGALVREYKGDADKTDVGTAADYALYNPNNDWPDAINPGPYNVILGEEPSTMTAKWAPKRYPVRYHATNYDKANLGNLEESAFTTGARKWDYALYDNAYYPLTEEEVTQLQPGFVPEGMLFKGWAAKLPSEDGLTFNPQGTTSGIPYTNVYPKANNDSLLWNVQNNPALDFEPDDGFLELYPVFEQMRIDVVYEPDLAHENTDTVRFKFIKDTLTGNYIEVPKLPYEENGIRDGQSYLALGQLWYYEPYKVYG
ncbi:MAG: hypothetical protein LBB50_06315, partial [Oscillospiraceae bacterium]|nr:hypothetical protein [Oscillospiraceae bacterium]